jgi:hypothetical protein
MPDAARLSLQQNYDLDGYAEAFGDDVTGLRKGLQVLFNQSDFEAFDLCGRRVVLTEPIDVQAAVVNKNTYANRRVIRNGQLTADDSTGWDDEVHTAHRQLGLQRGTELTNVSNAASIPVGALVTGPQGVGREVYVTAVNAAQGSVTLSAPLWGAPTQQEYTFTRFRYLLDFSGFLNLQRFVVSDIEFLCAGSLFGPDAAARRDRVPDPGLFLHRAQGPRRHLRRRGVPGHADRPLPVHLPRTAAARAGPRVDRVQHQLLGREDPRQPGGEVPAFRRHGRAGQHRVGQSFLPGR